jgi:hypothetical protein
VSLRLEFFYDCARPCSTIANHRLPGLRGRTGREVAYRRDGGRGAA